VLLPLLAAGGYLVEEFRNGNAHVLTLGALVGAVYLAERDRVLLAAPVLALSIVTKVTPVLLLLYFVAKGRWQLGIATVAWLAVLLAAPALIVGVEGNARLLRGFVSAATQMVDRPGNHSLRGALVRFFDAGAAADGPYPDVHLVDLPPFAIDALWLTLCAILAALAIPILARRATDRSAAVLDYAVIVAAPLVLAPHTQRIYFSVLFFPFCVLVALLAKYPRLPRARAVKTALAGAFIAGTLAPPLLPGRNAALAYEALSPYLWVTIGLLGLLLVLSRDLEQQAIHARSETRPNPT
jgi:hypothetical protein